MAKTEDGAVRIQGGAVSLTVISADVKNSSAADDCWSTRPEEI